VTVALDADALRTVVDRLRAAGCVFAEAEADLLADAAESEGHLASMVSRRLDGVPVEQVVGWADFCGLRIVVEPGVFVPRRRTEVLARQAAKAVRRGSVIVDMCCGSGAIGAAVATAAPGVELHAVDVDPVAVHCARANLARFGGTVHEGDLFTALPTSLQGRVDVVVVNAPYVPTDAIGLMPPEARLHEPVLALDGGMDGLDVHRRVAAAARAWLVVGGALHAECSDRQSQTLTSVYESAGLDVDVVVEDETCVVTGRRRT
jgi:release factor glutamine methyltransferase